jgi:hypothetical protein
MTDGFFSGRLERIYHEQPGFNALWAYKSGDLEKGATLNAQRTTNEKTN